MKAHANVEIMLFKLLLAICNVVLVVAYLLILYFNLLSLAEAIPLQFTALLDSPNEASMPTSNGKFEWTRAIVKLQNQTCRMQCIWWVLGIEMVQTQSVSFSREVMNYSYLFSSTISARERTNVSNLKYWIRREQKTFFFFFFILDLN